MAAKIIHYGLRVDEQIKIRFHGEGENLQREKGGVYSRVRPIIL